MRLSGLGEQWTPEEILTAYPAYVGTVAMGAFWPSIHAMDALGILELNAANRYVLRPGVDTTGLLYDLDAVAAPPQTYEELQTGGNIRAFEGQRPVVSAPSPVVPVIGAPELFAPRGLSPVPRTSAVAVAEEAAGLPLWALGLGAVALYWFVFKR